MLNDSREGSASASEIVSGCVQAHDAGIIVGQRSWGKGSVQTVHQISDEANVKLTTQFYRLPSPDFGKSLGRLVHKRRGSLDWGVVPDVEVSMSPEQITNSISLRQKADMILLDSEEERPDINDLITTGLDPQLETVVKNIHKILDLKIPQTNFTQAKDYLMSIQVRNYIYIYII